MSAGSASNAAHTSFSKSVSAMCIGAFYAEAPPLTPLFAPPITIDATMSRLSPIFIVPLALLLSACSAFNALLPQVATLAAPTQPPPTRTPRPTRTARPATEMPPATAVVASTRPTRTPGPTRTPRPATRTPEATSASSTAALGLPAGFSEVPAGDEQTRYENAALGVTLPNAWQLLPVNDAAALTAALDKIDPGMMGSWQRDIGSTIDNGLVLAAIDTSNVDFASKSAPVLWVTRDELKPGATVDLVAKAFEKSLRESAAIEPEITRRDVKLSSGDAVRVDYTFNADIGAGEVLPTSIAAYVIIKDDVLFLLQLSVPTSRTEDLSATFDDIANRFEALK
jgi:hypothetical protein